VLVLYSLQYYLEVVSNFIDTPPAPLAISRTGFRHPIRMFMLYNAVQFFCFSSSYFRFYTCCDRIYVFRLKLSL